MITGKTLNGYEFKLSPEDADLLDISWTGVTLRGKGHNRTYKYIVRRRGKTQNDPKIGIHRIIMERINQGPLSSSICVDHVNQDTLDNRRENLRMATRASNRYNGYGALNSFSGYRGVNWARAQGKWQARIVHERKRYFLGYFDGKEDAARAYNQKAKELYGEFAKLNEVPNA